MSRLRARAADQRSQKALGRPNRLADEVYEAILQQLMSLEIPPGGPINIDDLAREFGVSQTPIREALQHLEAHRLVIKTQFIGYTAAPQLQREQFDELCELRLRLEPYLAGKAAVHFDSKMAAELKSLSEEMSRSRTSNTLATYSQFARNDAIFHDKIAAMAGNQLIRETLSRLHTHVHLFRLMYHARVTNEAIDEHDEIIRGLIERDPAATSDAMRRHLEKSRERFVSFFATI